MPVGYPKDNNKRQVWNGFACMVSNRPALGGR